MSETINLNFAKARISVAAAITGWVSAAVMLTTILIYVLPAISKVSELESRVERQGTAINTMRTDANLDRTEMGKISGKLDIVIMMLDRDKK